jgi:hypothetical protein
MDCYTQKWHFQNWCGFQSEALVRAGSSDVDTRRSPARTYALKRKLQQF